MNRDIFVDSGWKPHPFFCSDCKHWLGEKDGKEICKAYPDGIPTEILFWTPIHRKPYPGDHGIQFEPKDAEAAKLLAQWKHISD